MDYAVCKVDALLIESSVSKVWCCKYIFLFLLQKIQVFLHPPLKRTTEMSQCVKTLAAKS